MEQTFEEAMEGSKLQRFAPDLAVFVVWHGGLTFNVYGYEGDRCQETDVWTVMDTPTFDEAVESIDRHFAEWRQEAEVDA